MKEVIETKAGAKTIFDTQDFEKVISEEVSYSAGEYFFRLVTDLIDKADYTQKKIKTDLTSYEMTLEEYSRGYSEILDILDLLQGEVNEKKTDKKKANTLISEIKKIINNTI